MEFFCDKRVPIKQEQILQDSGQALTVFQIEAALGIETGTEDASSGNEPAKL